LEKLYTGTFFIPKWRERENIDEEGVEWKSLS